MAVETTVTSAKAWAPDGRFIPAQEAIPDALILSTSIVAGQIEGDAPSIRVPWVDDADATFIAEGKEIPEADPDLAETTVYTGKVAQLLRISREQFAQPDAANLLADSVGRAVTNAANIAYLSQAAPASGATTPPAGILNQSIVDGGNVSDSLDGLVDLVAGIEGAGGVATHILAAPDAWGALRKVKTGEASAASLLGAGTADAQRQLLGVPVIVSSAVPEATLVVLDRNAIVSAVGPVSVAQSTEAYFASDSIGLRATFRFGAKVMHPDRVGTISTLAPERPAAAKSAK